MSERNRVLILYANYGEGHKMAAGAIEARLKTRLPFAHVETVDFLGLAYPFSDWVLRKLYLQTFSWAQPVYKQLYYKTKNNAVDSPLFTFPSRLLSLKLERYINDVQPSVVISTFPILTGVLAQIKERGTHPFKLHCVITDYVAHSQWLYHSVDRYFVPTEYIRQDLLQRGVTDASIHTTGIPVMPKFETRIHKAFLLKKWGLSPTKPVVLISAGAFGVINIKKACKQLVTNCPDIQFVVVCGRNQKLYDHLLEVPGLFPLSFTTKMHELMQLSDLFITKAGGLTVTEAIMSELPMLLFKSQPGQETENVKYLISQRVAKRVKSAEDLPKMVMEIVTNRSVYNEMKQNVSHLYSKLNHRSHLTDFILKDMSTNRNEVDTIRLRGNRLYEI